MYIDVILPLHLDSLFTYRLPKTSTDNNKSMPRIQRGMRVLVPFGTNKTYIAIVVNIHEKHSGQYAIKNVIDVLDEKPILTSQQFHLWQWISDYYISSLGDIYTAAVPSEMKTVEGYKRYLRRTAKQGDQKNIFYESKSTDIQPLNNFQEKAYTEIKDSFSKHNVTLLHGVTSSGKTEIYIHLIEEELKKGKQVLYILPEIALTVQIMQRLQKVFGERLGIYHSKYSDSERTAVWHKQLSSQPYDIILGVRSSVFLPFSNLGLVIIDEEHEASFKQQDPAPRYHARSVAVVLADMYKAKTLLGTATPSMESYYNVISGKYGLVVLSHRHKDIQMPEIKVVDIKDLKHRKMMNGPFSPQLIESINNALAAEQQVILFQNRRGFAPTLICKECGWRPKCSGCDVSLTYHKKSDSLTCHYCGHTYKISEICPECGGTKFIDKGFGTEKIEDYVIKLFPKAKVARMDLDTTKTRSAYENIISDFSNGNTNLLIGTQMVSKGLDFDKVGVVGILNADAMLNYPDFRAYEHAFMMMCQVSGRAGRKEQRGEVILQTMSPEMPLITQVVNNDYDTYFKAMLAERKMFHYPPFTHLIYIFIKHKKEIIADTAAIELSGRLKNIFGERVLGPDKPFIARTKNYYIRKIVLKLENTLSVSKIRKQLLSTQQELLTDSRYNSINIYCDVDPL